MSWLTISQTSGEGDAEITLSASSHTELEQRVASLKVYGQKAYAIETVMQEADKGFIVDPTSLTFDYKSGTQEISITANTSWEIYVDEGTYALSETAHTFSDTAETITITVTSDYDWTVSSEDDWITVTKGDGSFTVAVAENTGDTRNGTVTLYNYLGTVGATLSITQNEANGGTITLSETTYTFGWQEFSKEITVTASKSGWTASSDSDWITLSNYESLKGDCPVTIYTDTNYEDTNLNGAVTFFNKWGEKCATFSVIKECPDKTRVITYTSTDGYLVTPYTTTTVDGKTYKNGVGRIVLKEGTTSMAKFFYKCTNLKTATIPSCITSTGVNTFYGCTGLTSVTLDSVTSIEGWAFSGCTALESVVEESVTSIGRYAFHNCNKLKNINFQPLETIGNSAFSNCSALTEIVLPCVISIGEFGFSGCSSVTNVVLGGSPTIGDMAFTNCKELVEIDLGNVQYINQLGFYCCDKLSTIYVRNPVAPTLGDFVFADVPSTGTLYYPKGSDYSTWLTELDGWTGVEIEL